MEEENWQVVSITSGVIKARILEGRLEAEGIPVRLQYEPIGEIYAITVDGLGEVLASAFPPVFDPAGLRDYYLVVSRFVPYKRVDLVIWDPKLDEGYQLLGQNEAIEDLAMMNGYDSSAAGRPQIPQVERRLKIRVEKVLPFQRGAHMDEEET